MGQTDDDFERLCGLRLLFEPVTFDATRKYKLLLRVGFPRSYWYNFHTHRCLIYVRRPPKTSSWAPVLQREGHQAARRLNSWLRETTTKLRFLPQ